MEYRFLKSDQALARGVPSVQRRGAAMWQQAMMFTLLTAAALVAMSAHAQGAGTQADPSPQASAAPAAATPKYAVQDVERVFNYLDVNRDGKISREEAAAFKNIASHFDGADTNKDNVLSREEFEHAVNGNKPQ